MTGRWISVDELFDFAIEREQQTAEFYLDLAKRQKSHKVRDMLNSFAQTELNHKTLLKNVKAGKVSIPVKSIQLLNIAAQASHKGIGSDMDFEDALAFAMQMEEQSYRLYLELAAACEDNTLTNIFLTLAQQEAEHRLRFESEYKNSVLEKSHAC